MKIYYILNTIDEYRTDIKGYFSSLDKAKEAQRTAAGKRYCFVSRISSHLEELVSIIEKAAAYDAIKAEENAEKEAREKYEADLAKAKANYERRQAIYLRATDKMIAAQERFIEAEEVLRAIEEKGKQFEI